MNRSRIIRKGPQTHLGVVVTEVAQQNICGHCEKKRGKWTTLLDPCCDLEAGVLSPFKSQIASLVVVQGPNHVPWFFGHSPELQASK